MLHCGPYLSLLDPNWPYLSIYSYIYLYLAYLPLFGYFIPLILNILDKYTHMFYYNHSWVKAIIMGITMYMYNELQEYVLWTKIYPIYGDSDMIEAI